MVMTGTDFLSAQVFITDADGQHPREVTHLPAGGNDPSWSPDGSTIVFFSCPGQACPSREQEIYTIPSTGGHPRRLTFNNIEDNDPYYSPDGMTIAWLAQTDVKPDPGGVWNDLVMKADGSGQRNLTNDNMINSKPQWSNDGSRIFFHRFERGRRTTWSIFSIRLDGSGLTEVTKGQPGNNEYPCN
jgi:TolB protein